MNRRLVIVGAGYVGLITGACLAECGIPVTLVELDEDRVKAINAGNAPFFEPGLADLLRKVAGGDLVATTEVAGAVSDADLVMLAVGTPTVGGRIDLSQLVAAARVVGQAFDRSRGRPMVIIKSTVVPGTTERIVIPAIEAASGLTIGDGFGVAVNPEFLTEGTGVDDFQNPDRIVIGATDAETGDSVEKLYRSFDARIIRTTPATAEMIKYASNTLLATLISFSNELANLSSAIDGVDIVEVMDGVHASRYLTTETSEGPIKAAITSFLEAGCGYGGSCLPKDTQALAAWGEALGVRMRVLEAVDDVNQRQPARVMEIVQKEMGGVAGRRIGVLGLAFKPNTSDVRESPALPVIRMLLEEGAEVWAHDPEAIPTASRVLETRPSLHFEPDLATVVESVDALVVLTRWDQYRQLSAMLRALNRSPLVVDGRRFLDRSSFERYAGIGL